MWRIVEALFFDTAPCACGLRPLSDVIANLTCRTHTGAHNSAHPDLLIFASSWMRVTLCTLCQATIVVGSSHDAGEFYVEKTIRAWCVSLLSAGRGATRGRPACVENSPHFRGSNMMSTFDAWEVALPSFFFWCYCFSTEEKFTLEDWLDH